MRISLGLFSVAAFVSIFACTPAREPEEEVTSATDDLRPGGSIRIPGTGATPPGVDASAEYADSRALATLEQLAQMSADERAVVTRADGMLASHERDGRVSVDELAQLAAPDFIIVLTPGEKAALKTVWRFMVAPRETRVTVPVLPSAIAPFSLDRLRVNRADPTPIARPAARTKFRVDEVGASWGSDRQAVIVRVEKGFNDDGDASTVTLADLDAAGASLAFTPDEHDTIAFVEEHLKQVSSSEAINAQLSSPKSMKAELHELPPSYAYARAPGADGVPLSFGIYRGTSYTELRTRRFADGNLDVKLWAEQSWSYSLVSDDHSLLRLDAKSGWETVDAPATPGQAFWLDMAVPAVLELWADGAPRFRVRHMPEDAVRSSTTDLRSFLGYAMYVRHDGAEHLLVQNFSYSYSSPEEAQGYTSFDETPRDEQDLQNFAILNPESPIRNQGRYQFTLPDGRGTARIEIYPVQEGTSHAQVSSDRRAVRVRFGQAMTGVPEGTVLDAIPGGNDGQRLAHADGTDVEVVGEHAYLREAGKPDVDLALDLDHRQAW